MTIAGDSIHVDFAGTARQVPGRHQLAAAVHEVRGLRRDPARARPLDPELGRLLPGDHGHGRRGDGRQPRLPGRVRGARDHRLPGHGRRHRRARPGRPGPRARRRRGRQHDHLDGRRRRGGPAVRVRRHVLGRPRCGHGLRRPGRRAASGLEQRQHADRDRREHLPAPLPALRDRRGFGEPRAVARLAGPRPRVRLPRPGHAGPGPFRQAGPPAVRAGRRGAGSAVDDDRRPRRRGHRATGHRPLAVAHRRPVPTRARQRRRLGRPARARPGRRPARRPQRRHRRRPGARRPRRRHRRRRERSTWPRPTPSGAPDRSARERRRWSTARPSRGRAARAG